MLAARRALLDEGTFFILGTFPSLSKRFHLERKVCGSCHENAAHLRRFSLNRR
ncbi:MAG: hypothetical protein QOH63_289 [Acidobacteriota bacterium]|jgi:hypothetical protein|nr:hypothetical protein [Acidobacteriota bacterium]